MLSAIDFTDSEHWAPFNFPLSTALYPVVSFDNKLYSTLSFLLQCTCKFQQLNSGALIYFTLQSTPPLSSPLLPHSQPNSMLTVYVSIVTYQGIPVSSYDVGSGLNGLPLTGN